MSKKGMLGIDLMEWNILSGLSDPYALELAKISAAAGVPRPSSLEEAMPEFKKEKRLADIKRSHRALRRSGAIGGEDPLERKNKMKQMGAQLQKLLRQKSEDGEQYVFSYDVYLEAFLEDAGSSLYEFNMLMDYAIEHEDLALVDELLAVEEMLDEALGATLAGAAKAVGGAVAKGAKAVGQGAMKAGQVAAKGAQAVGGAAMKGAKSLAGQAKTGFQQGMKAAGQAADAAAAPAAAPAPAAPAPTAAAPAPAPAAAPQAQTATAAGGGAAPAQPGQTAPAAKQPKEKKVTGLARLARGIGKVAKGVVSLPGGIARSAGSAVGQVAGGIKKGYAGEDIEYWEEFLGENDLTIDQYMMVVEHAFEIGDEEMIESAHELDEMFAKWKAKKEAERAKKAADTQAAWARARAGKEVQGSQERTRQGLDMTPAQKAEMEKRLRAGGAKYQQAPPPQRIRKSASEAIEKQLALAGYTDEYLEARSKEKQRAGLVKQMGKEPGKYSDEYVSQLRHQRKSKDSDQLKVRADMSSGQRRGINKLQAKSRSELKKMGHSEKDLRPYAWDKTYAKAKLPR